MERGLGTCFLDRSKYPRSKLRIGYWKQIQWVDFVGRVPPPPSKPFEFPHTRTNAPEVAFHLILTATFRSTLCRPKASTRVPSLVPQFGQRNAAFVGSGNRIKTEHGGPNWLAGAKTQDSDFTQLLKRASLHGVIRFRQLQ